MDGRLVETVLCAVRRQQPLVVALCRPDASYLLQETKLSLAATLPDLPVHWWRSQGDVRGAWHSDAERAGAVQEDPAALEHLLRTRPESPETEHWPRVRGSVVLLDNATAVVELLSAYARSTGDSMGGAGSLATANHAVDNVDGEADHALDRLTASLVHDALPSATVVVLGLPKDAVPPWVAKDRPMLTFSAPDAAATAAEVAPLRGYTAAHRHELCERYGVRRELTELTAAVDSHLRLAVTEADAVRAFSAAEGASGSRTPRGAGAVRRAMKPPTGVLLYGEHAAGKGLIAALCREAFPDAAFFVQDSTALFGKYLGETEENLRALFRRARASERPSVIVLDNIECIGLKRETGDGAEATAAVNRRVLAALLCEMDGIEGSGGALVVGITARPMDLDSALVRQGRLEVTIEVGASRGEEHRRKRATCFARAVADVDFDGDATKALATALFCDGDTSGLSAEEQRSTDVQGAVRDQLRCVAEIEQVARDLVDAASFGMAARLEAAALASTAVPAPESELPSFDVAEIEEPPMEPSDAAVDRSAVLAVYRAFKAGWSVWHSLT